MDQLSVPLSQCKEGQRVRRGDGFVYRIIGFTPTKTRRIALHRIEATLVPYTYAFIAVPLSELVTIVKETQATSIPKPEFKTDDQSVSWADI